MSFCLLAPVFLLCCFSFRSSILKTDVTIKMKFTFNAPLKSVRRSSFPLCFQFVQMCLEKQASKSAVSFSLSPSLKGRADTSLIVRVLEKTNQLVEVTFHDVLPQISDQNKAMIFSSKNPFAFMQILKRIHLYFIFT